MAKLKTADRLRRQLTSIVCMLALAMGAFYGLSTSQAQAGQESSSHRGSPSKGGGKVGAGIAIGVGAVILGAAIANAAKKKKKKQQKRKPKKPGKKVAKHCPANAYANKRGKCSCKKGYKWSGKGRKARCAKRGTDVASKKCPANAYANKRGKCSCKKGYNWSGKGRKARCVKRGTDVASKSCPSHARRSKSGKCYCAKGYKWKGRGRKAICAKVAPPKIVVKGPKCNWPEVVKRGKRSCVCARGYKRTSRNGQCRRIDRKPAPQKPKTDTARIQDCLQKTGYEPGPVDGKGGRKTVQAFRQFQRSEGLKRTGNLSDRTTQKRLFAACDAGPRIAKAPTKPALPVNGFTQTVAVAGATSATLSSPLRGDCLEPELFELVRGIYGARGGQQACTPTCLSRPERMNASLLDEISKRHNITWCEDCVKIKSYLPLGDILRIEKAANINLCGAPLEEDLCRLPQPTVASSGDLRTIVKTRVRTILKHLPPAADHRGDVAVIIGNETYRNGLPANANGRSDAIAMQTLLVEHLGYREDNILMLENATLADLRRVFGGDEQPGGELGQLLRRNGTGNVFVYASSHGAALRPGESLLAPAGSLADDQPRNSFLLPVDARNDDTIGSAYPLGELYARLEGLKAASVVVALEADFAASLHDRIVRPNLPVNEVNAIPEKPVPGLVVIKASEKDQRTLEDPLLNIGLFTRYMIEGYGGRADSDRFGRQDGRIDAVELYAFVAQHVMVASRKSFNMKQKPILHQIENLVVGSLIQR